MTNLQKNYEQLCKEADLFDMEHFEDFYYEYQQEEMEAEDED